MENASGGFGSGFRFGSVKRQWLCRLIAALHPPMPALNVMPTELLAKIRVALFRPGNVVLNVGAGGLSGCGRRLWKNVDESFCRIIHLDLKSGPLVNLRANAESIPIADGSVDVVVMQAVMEHLLNPRAAIEEATRVLRPGGLLYVEIPFLQGFHADPHDYQRYTLEGLRQRLRRFEELESGVSVGPFCSLVWLLRDGLSSCFRNRLLYAASRFTVGWLLSPLRYLDYLVRRNPAAYRLANEYYFLCRKPST